MEGTSSVSALMEHLYTVLPLERAMTELVPKSPAFYEALQTATRIDRELLFEKNDSLRAGLWLYVDELERSHAVSQAIHDTTGSFWHAIMHRREGDFGNSKYWYRQAEGHPVIEEVGYDPFAYVDAVQAGYRENTGELVDLQRREWKSLFDWCVEQISAEAM